MFTNQMSAEFPIEAPPMPGMGELGTEVPPPAPAYYHREPGVVIPEEVADYLKYFKRCVLEQNVKQIDNLYQFGFSDLTDRFYRERFWPNEEQVAQVVKGGEVQSVSDSRIFLILYKELYYRYVYGKIQRGPSLEHRYNSYQNYQELFTYLLDTPEPVALNLPNSWLWDIVDEFVYQFQSFCQYKSNPNKRGQDEVEELMQIERDVWNLYPVLNILYSVVSKSQINAQLAAMREGRNPDDVADNFGRHPLYFKLGYFSLVGLLRVHILLGDYKQALSTVENVNFDPKGLYNSVPSCFVALHYYVGFSHLMMRHYQEAIRIFVNCLLYIQRTRNVNQQQQNQKSSWQYDVVSKTNDQLYQLLAICMVLQPQRIDESVHSQLTEKLSERMNRMQKGELTEFENAFQFGCPKFLAPTIATFEPATGNLAKEPTLHQTRMFMDEIKQQQLIPILRGYLKLYSSIPLTKLASFMDLEVEKLAGHLLSFKHKLLDTSREDQPEDAEDASADLDFFIDKDMIHVADTKVGRRHGEYFIRHIQKLMELNKNLSRLNFVPTQGHQRGRGGAQRN